MPPGRPMCHIQAPGGTKLLPDPISTYRDQHRQCPLSISVPQQYHTCRLPGGLGAPDEGPTTPSHNLLILSSLSTLDQVMACCLTTPSHYLIQCWLMATNMFNIFLLFYTSIAHAIHQEGRGSLDQRFNMSRLLFSSWDYSLQDREASRNLSLGIANAVRVRERGPHSIPVKVTLDIFGSPIENQWGSRKYPG